MAALANGQLRTHRRQVSHFRCTDGNDYSKQRYLNEYVDLLAVMNYQLQRTPYLGGEDYSISDMLASLGYCLTKITA